MRTKRGFTPPMGDWIRNDLRPVFEEVASKYKGYGLFSDKNYVKNLLKLHLNGQDLAKPLYKLMSISRKFNLD